MERISLKKGAEFTLNEYGKQRNIRALTVRDITVQHTLCDSILYDALVPHLIHDSGASIRGKGLSFTRRRFEQHLRSYIHHHGYDGYVLKIDFKKYFDSIDHEKLLQSVLTVTNDKELVSFLALLMRGYELNGERKSLAIGAPISQILGVFFPIKIDTYCKTVKGLKYYDAYMDDRIIIHEDKEYLKSLLEEIRAIATELGLTINDKKTQIIKISHGFTFLKTRYIVTKPGKIVKKLPHDTISRERRKLKKMAKSNMSLADFEKQYASWRGDKRKYNSYRTLHSMDRLFNELKSKYFNKR